MIRYALKTQNGEIVNTIPANSSEEAAESFAKLKRISVDDLLKIYIVSLFNR